MKLFWKIVLFPMWFPLCAGCFIGEKVSEIITETEIKWKSK